MAHLRPLPDSQCLCMALCTDRRNVNWCLAGGGLSEGFIVLSREGVSFCDGWESTLAHFRLFLKSVVMMDLNLVIYLILGH